jgi:hypothetical protein
MAMRIPVTDYEQREKSPGVVEREFDKRANLVEGINGCDRMDTHFENTERTQVLDPRGDHTGRPMPRDAKFRGANNHGEWGPDQFIEELEKGMDGPMEGRPYYGMGLPKRTDLRPCADPQCEDPRCEGHALDQLRPMGQGVGKKEM